MNKNKSVVSLCAVMMFAAAFAGSAAASSEKSPISDAWITAKTKMSLAADGRVKGRRVSVETTKGRVALRGKVETDEAKAAAEETTKLLDGVKSVKNELQVVAPSRQAAVEDKDEMITPRVKKAFAKDKALSKADIGVVTNDGVVSLTGEVLDFTTSAKASWTAWKQSGVKYVKNDLTLKAKGS